MSRGTAERLTWLDAADQACSCTTGPLGLAGAGGTVVVVSDLHLAEGRRADASYPGTENFFADGAFARYLDWLHADLGPEAKPALVIINGDFVDFMRVVRVPAHDSPDTADLIAWQGILATIGIRRDRAELQVSVSPKEDRFGLKTDDYKSVWKLAMAATGHLELFTALAGWVARGHRLAIVSGNHDLEWYWKPVRDYLRDLLLDLAGDLPDPSGFLHRIWFSHELIVVDGRVVVEHGHRFDRFTRVLGEPTLPGGRELNIPFGSFFNRYLINRIELDYPYLDNIRPQPAVLPFLVRQRFPLALKLLFDHLPFALRIIPKRYYAYLLRRAIWFLLAVVLPAVTVGILLWKDLAPVFGALGGGERTGLGALAANVVKDAAWLVGSYVLSQLVAALQLTEPSDLDEPAARLLAQHPGWQVLTMGHTHNPSVLRREGQWFFNTSTWIDVVEISSGALRMGSAYLFLRVPPVAPPGGPPAGLWRWNDEAGRPDPAVVVSRLGDG